MAVPIWMKWGIEARLEAAKIDETGCSARSLSQEQLGDLVPLLNSHPSKSASSISLRMICAEPVPNSSIWPGHRDRRQRQRRIVGLSYDTAK
jgi:hypothetical protein